MPSPFPGMNPYLEQAECWEDFHNLFMSLLAAEINDVMPSGYFAKVEVRLYLCEAVVDSGRFIGKADPGIRGANRDPTPVARKNSAAPMSVELDQSVEDSVNLPAVEIRSRKGLEVVTVLELLSPTNKSPGNDWTQFEHKRRQVLRSASNYVEFDFLRGGRRHNFATVTPSVPYYVLVARPSNWPHAEFWPFGLQDPLPRIGIPPKYDVEDIEFDLQLHLNRVYDKGRFREFAYDAGPEPPLSPEDAAWAVQYVPRREE